MKLLCWERESAFCISSYLSDLLSKTAVPFKSGVWDRLLFPWASTTYLLKLMTITAPSNIKDLPCFRLCSAVTRFWHHRRRALFSPCGVPPCRLSLYRFAPITWGTPSLPFPWGPGTPLWPRTRYPKCVLGNTLPPWLTLTLSGPRWEYWNCKELSRK